MASIPTHQLKAVSELTLGDCFMPIPEEQTLGPCIRIETITEEGWNLKIKGQIVAVPPKKVDTEKGPVLHRRASHLMNGTPVSVGDTVELSMARDATVATPNPAVAALIRKTQKKTICRDGKIHVTYTCADLPKEWQGHFRQIIAENMAQKNLYLSEVSQKDNWISGIVNTIPGHPNHEDHRVPYHPIPALFVRSSIQPTEQAGAIQTLKAFCGKGGTIQDVDGEWRVTTTLRGQTSHERANNLQRLQDALAEIFLAIEPDDEAAPFDNQGKLTGFIHRHPDTFERVKKIWEGKEVDVNI